MKIVLLNDWKWDRDVRWVHIGIKTYTHQRAFVFVIVGVGVSLWYGK